MKKDGKTIFQFPIFSRWANGEIESYSIIHTEADKKNLPLRKGIPRGQKLPLSLAKHAAAVYSAGFGKQLRDATLEDLVEFLPDAPSLPVLRNWRKEKRFKKIVDGLKQKFAEHIAGFIFHGGPELLPFLGFDSSKSELLLKVCYIREALAYPPDLVERIASFLAKFANSVETRTVNNYLGYHIFCIQLLQLTSEARPKSRERKIYSRICRKILCKHCDDHLLVNYLTENASPTYGMSTHLKWPAHFKNCRKHAEAYLQKGDYASLQNEYRVEMAAILNSEIAKLPKGENEVDFEDIKRGVNFLAGIYKFKKSELGIDEEATFIF